MSQPPPRENAKYFPKGVYLRLNCEELPELYYVDEEKRPYSHAVLLLPEYGKLYAQIREVLAAIVERELDSLRPDKVTKD